MTSIKNLYEAKNSSSYDKFVKDNFDAVYQIYHKYEEIIRNVSELVDVAESTVDDVMTIYAEKVKKHLNDNTTYDQPIPQTKKQFKDELLYNIEISQDDIQQLSEMLDNIKKCGSEIENIKKTLKI